MKIQLRRPFFPPESIKKVKKEIDDVLNTGILTLGKQVRSFELKFAKFQRSKYAIAVSSATAGLHISLLSLGIKREDEVIVPAKTFISTAFAPMYCSAIPVFCDVDNVSYQLNPKKLEKLITKKTKAIIPVHLGGNVCPMDEIIEIAKKHDLHVIEDAAHSNGSTLNGKKAGTFGKLGVFSFYPDKVMASCDGGCIVTNNKNLYEKLLLLRNIGRKKGRIYSFSEVGYNYRMNEIQAVLSLEQLRILPSMIIRRREIAKKYDEELHTISKLQIPTLFDGVKSAYYAYILKLKSGNLSKFRSNLFQKGIETSPMFTTLYKTTIFEKRFGKKEGLCPVSENLDAKTFTIPLHVAMKNSQVNYVIKQIKSLLK
jgi:perosamine synthetase